MVRLNRKSWKDGCVTRIKDLFATHEKCFLVKCDNVSSTQIHQVRKSLKGDATILFGKKTLIKYALKSMNEMGADFTQLYNHLNSNVAIVFVKNDMMSVRERLLANKRISAAKIGSIAQKNVVIPPHNTGMPPDKISLFQILGVPTKVVKGTLEMTMEKLVLKEGQRVGPNEATLLRALKISPLVYGLTISKVFEDGCVFDDSLLDINDTDFDNSIKETLTEMTCFALGVGFPTEMSVAQTMAACFRDMVNVSLAVDYDMPEARSIREMLSNPEYVHVAETLPEAATVVEEKVEAKPVEEEEESSDDFENIFG